MLFRTLLFDTQILLDTRSSLEYVNMDKKEHHIIVYKIIFEFETEKLCAAAAKLRISLSHCEDLLLTQVS